MKVEYSPELLELLRSKKKRNISIEVASSDHSDIEVTEIFLRYVTDEFADYLVQKKKYVDCDNKYFKESLLSFSNFIFDIAILFGNNSNVS